MQVGFSVKGEEWWRVVESMADFVACGFDYHDLDDDVIREALTAQGFAEPAIEQAMDWLEMASTSGHLVDVFSMLIPLADATRVASPLETICISDKLWTQFEEIRSRGLISQDLAERILEGMRSLDTRDWEDEDVKIFIEEILSTMMPHLSNKFIKRLLARKGNHPEFYS